MREERSHKRKLLSHLALTKSVLSAQHDLLDVIFHHSCFPFFRDLSKKPPFSTTSLPCLPCSAMPSAMRSSRRIPRGC